MIGFAWASAGQVAEAIRRREVSAVEVLAGQLDRFAQYDPGLCSVITLDAGGARRRAEGADKAVEAGEVWVRCTGWGSPLKTSTPRRGCGRPSAASVRSPTM
jgi:Asp-tRNA(Asn)/Glu-tRNA(Gln) amidotransferase A subunit family amidase